MTAAQVQAGATSQREVDWHAIDWLKVNQNVSRLQARIVKATQEGRWGKVKALQRLLTHSFSAKALAVRRVTENQGKRTPGIDQQTWETPAKKAQAVQNLRQHNYRAQPLRRVYIPKANGKSRPLGIPTMKDRAMQALYSLALDPVAETKADPNSYGFRKERAPADAIGRCFNSFARKGAPGWIMEGDIRACFDTISHDWLLANIPMDKAILRQWLKAGYLFQRKLYPTEDGSAQGGPISPVLANLTLDGLEKLLWEHYPRYRRIKGQHHKVSLTRYADDFIVTGSSKAQLETQVKPLIEGFLKERGLELSQEKTKFTRIEDGFNFLGQNIRQYRGKTIIKPAKENVKAFLVKVRAFVKSNKQLSTGKLIAKLNPMILGWANYHRHVVSNKVFRKVDHIIFQRLWHWAKRRHPHKSKRWLKDKYFPAVGTRRWVFSGQIVTKQGAVVPIRLNKAGDVSIKRHIKIKEYANPYDREWESYFDQRLGLKWLNGTKRKRLVYLWKEQNGRCVQCQQRITEETGWHTHHLTKRSNGGNDNLTNLVLVHPNCHMQVHSQDIKVVKPGSTKNLRKA